MTVALLLLTLIPGVRAAPPSSTWPAPTGIDANSPLTNCDRAKAVGTGGECTWKLLSDAGAGGSAVLGLAAAVAATIPPPAGNYGRAEPGIAWASGFALTLGSAQIVKTLAERPRPYTYNAAYTAPAESCTGLVGPARDDCWSFFSGHTAITAYNLYYAASAIDLYAPKHSPWVNVAGYAAATLGTAFVGTARVEAGQHFWSDVAVGAAVGAGLGLASPRVTHAVSALIPHASAQLSPTFLGISGTW